MNNYLVNLSFNGTRFYGTQKQPNLETIQGIFERLISKYTSEKIKVTNCSRLDRFVHAKDFYFNFKTSKEIILYKFMHYIQEFTSNDIYIKNVTKVKDDFNARYHPVSKTYCYKIKFDYPNPFDYETIFYTRYKLVNTDLPYKLFLNEHNFINFSSDDDSEDFTGFIDDINIECKDNIFYFYITGKKFFRYQVRYMVGILFEIMIGKKNEKDLLEMLDGSKKYTKQKLMMPGNGLTLEKVNYNKEDYYVQD